MLAHVRDRWLADDIINPDTYAKGVEQGWNNIKLYRLIVRELQRSFHSGTDADRRTMLANRPHLTGTKWDAAMAAVIEHTARVHGYEPPGWVDEPERFLNTAVKLTKVKTDSDSAWQPGGFLRHGVSVDSGKLVSLRGSPQMQPMKAFSQAVNATETDPRLKNAKAPRVRRRCLAVRAVYGFLAAAALLTLPLPAQAQIAVWSSTLTVRDLGNNNVLGCGIHITDGRCSTYLGNDTFTHYGKTYEFLIISLHPNGDLVTSFNRNLANNTRDLRLNVDGRAFAFENADNPNRTTRRWNNSRLNWATGDTVSLTLTDHGKPGIPAPPLVAETRGSNTSLDVGWVEPANAGPFIEYDLAYTACAEEEELCAAFDTGPQNITTTFSTIEGLAENTTYQVRVRAKNPKGTRGWSHPGSGRTTAGGTPASPTNLTATKDGHDRIDLSWTAPSDPDESPVRSYHVEIKSEASNWLVLVVTTGNTATEYSHRDVPAGVLRRYRVSAINTNGTGPPSNVDEATTDSADDGGGDTPDPQMQQSQTPLTVSFVSVPATHDGETPFWLELSFDAPVAPSSKPQIQALLGVTGGSLSRLRRKDGQLDHWQIRIEPSSQNAVTVTLAPSPPCGQPSAICTEDGRTFTTGLATQIHGPASGNNWSEESAGTAVTPVPALPLAGIGLLGLLLTFLGSRRRQNDRHHISKRR